MSKRFKKIYIEITNICNLKCKFCPEIKREKEYMSAQKFEHIVKEVSQYTDLVALHIKGEPLLHPNIQEILELCNKYNLMVNITTNGTLLKDNIEILSNAKALRQLNVSIHVVNQNNIDTKQYMKDVLDSIRKIRDHKDIYISYRLWEYNKKKDNKEIFELFSNEYNILNIEEQLQDNMWIKLDTNVYINQDVEFIWPDVNGEILNEEGTCYGLRQQLGILVDGTVVPCCLDQEGNICLGNIFEKSLDKIINSNEAIEIRRGFENNILLRNLCKTCGYVTRFQKEENG